MYYREKASKIAYTTSQTQEDATQEIRDIAKGKWEEDYTDGPSDD
jgi:hypothetical protein